ncbi:MAG: monofunctional biosynthetic peptidoglycan transglycosylase [Crocinitomicaceae bacterium]|nr:monofunctional biosynthetic peptidoglycan transglycosylase [Crocinitomicaceae bacterium]
MAKKVTPQKSIWQRIWSFCWKSAIGFFIVTVVWVILYRWVNPPVTFLQLKERINCSEGMEFHKTWADADEISLYMKLAVVASEDNNFMKHYGLDWGAIKKARAYNETHKKTRGASTISQQVAKNVFLWPSRSWIRKGFEVYFTYLIEFFWSKERILEVYLNVIETGPCKFGVEAAAHDYFHTSAAKLTRDQAALIAACLPNPKKMNPSKPGSYMMKRQSQIARLTRLIGDNYFERYSEKTDKMKRIKEEMEVQKKIEELPPGELPGIIEEEIETVSKDQSLEETQETVPSAAIDSTGDSAQGE